LYRKLSFVRASRQLEAARERKAREGKNVDTALLLSFSSTEIVPDEEVQY
jgi:hypothetical protein